MGSHPERQERTPPERVAKTGFILFVGSVGVLGALVVSLIYGSVNLNISTVWQAVFEFNSQRTEHQIIQEIRLPRALTAVLVGAYFALSGAIMQAITRNPLAEPSLLGVSYGAAFALVLTLALFPGISSVVTAIVSMMGAGLTVLLMFSLAVYSKGGLEPVKLALAGIAIGMFLSSLTSVIALYFDVSKELSFWYAGGLAAADWTGLRIVSMVGLIGIPIAILLARPLTLLHLGAEVTQGLGINLRLVYILGVFAVLLLTGSSVAVCGTIGFVGLVVPHISRMLVGSDYRFLLPISAVLGSLLLVLADVGARMIHSPFETPIGVVTAAIGVPFFLYLVRSKRSKLT